MWMFISQRQRPKDKIWWEWMQNSIDKDKTENNTMKETKTMNIKMEGENEREWKKETYGKGRDVHATWKLHSHQDKTKGDEITLTQAHTICAEFLYFIQIQLLKYNG